MEAGGKDPVVTCLGDGRGLGLDSAQLHSPNNPVRYVLLFYHFTDGETKAQRS